MKEYLLRKTIETFPRSLSSRMAGQFVPVFMLHRFVGCDGEPDQKLLKNIAAFLEYLRAERYHTITLDTLLECQLQGRPLPEKAAVFTVDDGFWDQVSVAGPLFAQYDCPLTLYAVTEFVDGKLWLWDDQVRYVLTHSPKATYKVNLPDGSAFFVDSAKDVRQQSRALRNKLKAMNQTGLYDWLPSLYSDAGVEYTVTPPGLYRAASWSELQSFTSSGHFVGPHTLTHRILSQLNSEDAQSEIEGSLARLQEKLPRYSNTFAYPTGRQVDFTDREEAVVQKSPLLGAVSTVADAYRVGYPVTAIPRYSIPDSMTNFYQYISFIEVLKNKIRGVKP